MKIYFITGSDSKLLEVQKAMPDVTVEMLKIDLPELQEVDGSLIIRAKLETAFAHHSGPFIVEDTSLSFLGMNGLPGPLIKWFLKKMGLEGLADLARRLDNQEAEARTIIGYAEKQDGEIRFFEGTIRGKIVAPRGVTNFGWDPIFQPEGQERTFAEMSLEEKNEFSMRRLAVERLKEYLSKR